MEIVVLLRILVHDCNYGYRLSNGMAMVLQTINGEKVKNMRHLVNSVRTSKDEYLRFEFGGQAGLRAGALIDIAKDAGVYKYSIGRPCGPAPFQWHSERSSSHRATCRTHG